MTSTIRLPSHPPAPMMCAASDKIASVGSVGAAAACPESAIETAIAPAAIARTGHMPRRPRPASTKATIASRIAPASSIHARPHCVTRSSVPSSAGSGISGAPCNAYDCAMRRMIIVAPSSSAARMPT